MAFEEEDDRQPPDHREFTDRERNVEIMARRFELDQLRDRVWAGVVPDHVDLVPPSDWRHSVTGRRQLGPSVELLHFGRYLRRARRIVALSQENLGRLAGVTQSMISRAERGLAPAMGLERLTMIGRVLGRGFPLGFCPHEHDCAWQPIRKQEYRKSDVERLVQALLQGASQPVTHDD